MNQLAIELNSFLSDTAAYRLMSPLGKRMFFPKGIIAQSTEAKKSAHSANATIGMAFNNGRPLILSAVAETMPAFTPEQSVVYAPTAGFEELRKEWKKLILQKNKSLSADSFSLPAVVSGLTAGLSAITDIFLPESSVLLASDPCWDNYSLIAEERRGAILKTIPFFNEDPGGLDLAAIAKAVSEEAKTGTVRMILNFPNNPSGYSPTDNEARELAGIFLKAAESGADVLVICDDAYFGLFYEKTLHHESMFSLLAGLHEKILAVKIGGPIKEDYVWGLRIGFVSFGSKGLSQKHYEALVTKLMGAIRSSVSCTNTPAQHIVLKAINDERSAAEKKHFGEMMKARYKEVKAFTDRHHDNKALKPLPFNSGYFMCFRCLGFNAEELRTELLTRHGIGTISFGSRFLRVAFSSLDVEKINDVYSRIYETAEAIKSKS